MWPAHAGKLCLTLLPRHAFFWEASNLNDMLNHSFTDGHYKELQELYDQYKERGLEILAFPCDQFKQAKGDSCRLDLEKYKITFEMFAKVSPFGSFSLSAKHIGR